jgi:hypothetical protein
MTDQVLHIDLVALSDKATREARATLAGEAAGLTSLAEVVTAGVIEAEAGADFDIALFFVLHDFTALEPFGTNPEYVRFLQGSIAPVLRAFAGADVRLENDMPPMRGYAACLSLTAPDETYDWEVKSGLSQWALAVQGASAVVGLAVGERQRYRGLALAFGDEPFSACPAVDQRFGSTLVTGRSRGLP